MKHTKFIVVCSSFIVLAFLAVTSNAEVVPHTLFSDNMVLQQGKPVLVWGKADTGEKVTVSIQGQEDTVVAQDGKWMVKLDPLKAGGPFTMSIKGNNTIEINNVLVGEVWVCSGQSNMQWTVSRSNNPEEEIQNANYPKIRLITVPRVAGKPQESFDGKWVECSPDTIPEFSAVGYFFGRTLYKDLDVPIGLIHSSWGGTPAESWTTRETLESNSQLKPIVERGDKGLADYAKELEKLEADYMDWKYAAEYAETQGKPIPSFPDIPRDPRSNPWRPSGLYNAMISPLIPYAIQGAIWYQGESNAGRAYQYRTLFPAMIKDWRSEWGQGDFTFLFVQLANFKSNGAWPELREAQTMTLQLPNTGMAVTTDIGNPVDIHPRNKQDVGKRLALAAEAITYGKDVVYSGPMYDKMEKEGRKNHPSFHSYWKRLANEGRKLEGFTIAGEDKEFVPAQAEIDGDTVVVQGNRIDDPIAVRYAWEDNPENANLYNKEGLPASPFRTDDFPGVTEGNL